MRSPAFPPEAVLVIVYVRVWVVPMSTSPGAAGAVWTMVNVLAACAGMLAAARVKSRARKPQRFMLPSRFLAQQFSRLNRSRGRNFPAFSALNRPVHRALRASDISRRRRLGFVVVPAAAGAVRQLRPHRRPGGPGGTARPELPGQSFQRHDPPGAAGDCIGNVLGIHAAVIQADRAAGGNFELSLMRNVAGATQVAEIARGST